MTVLDLWLARWKLVLDGSPLATPTSHLIPVRQDGVPLMLKIALHEEERRGSALMAYYTGDNAARVLACEGEALLMERARGGAPLIEMARSGRDDEATTIICGVIARLHAPRKSPLPSDLPPLHTWFRELDLAGLKHGGLFAEGAITARELLAHPREIVVLHGDIHHGNVLFDDARGWLAIDPKGGIGERYFDYTNIFCNPDFATATATGRLQSQVKLIATDAHLEPDRLMRWVFAYACLSASWSLAESEDAIVSRAVAEIAASALGLH